ncbi:MAG: PQQ-binding-like beta-propeller repeat protein [Planctomycetes bacterium]|nr:PQQ-binding-like beta-propeller repeat protein [Planctomycetota bacterium]
MRFGRISWALLLALGAWGSNGWIHAEGEGEPKPPAEEPKPEGPEHNVLLNEEEEVKRLLKKARKAREAEDWPTCVRAYADILQKFPTTVYLYRWQGDGEEKARAWGLGVYRSTAEKINEELASLPEGGRRVYLVMNDTAARGLLNEAQERLDERQAEQVAQSYFSSSLGDDALMWLGEVAYDRGAHRQALVRLQQIEKHPEPSVPKVAVLARLFLSQVGAGLADQARSTLDRLRTAAQDPKHGVLRIGHAEGEAALADLAKRLQVEPEAVTPLAAEGSGLETYFGNAEHHRPVPAKSDIGVLKWSEPLVRLLGAPAGTKDDGLQEIQSWQGEAHRVRMLDHHLVARGGWFFICGEQVVACHSVNNPNPDRPQFLYPPQGQAVAPAGQTNVRGQNRGALTQYPLFCTLGGEHLYVVQGPPEPVQMPQFWGGNQQPSKPNWIVCVGKKKGGTLGIESGSLRWSLEPGTDPDFRINGKEDQEWLKGIRFCSSPTYADGSLYVLANGGTGASKESWGICLDAGSGRILWKTLICSGAQAFFGGPVQPAPGLPVAVAGGSVYCVTNLGAVAALDAATGQVRWIRVYDRVATADQNMRGMQMSNAQDFWGPNPPLMVDDVLVVTPQDSMFMYGLDPQTGRRVWQTERVSDAGLGAPGDAERLKHILGVANGRLIVSGRDVLFIEAKGGRREVRVPLRDTYELVGRGCVTSDEAYVSTDQGILRINAKLHPESGKPIGKLVSIHKWKDGGKDNVEAGNLFIAGDVLFSISSTHVNAFFVLEEVEKKIEARIQAEPNDLSHYLELGDVRMRGEAYEKAIAAFNAGLEAAVKQEGDPKVKTLATELKARKFEAYHAAGEKLMSQQQPDPKLAYDMYDAALKNAQTPDQPVRALWRMAEARLALDDAPAAVLLFHRLLTEYGDTVYGFGAASASKASVYAQRRIGQIKEETPVAVAELEKLARQAFDQALQTQGVEALEKVARQFPNSEAYGDTLMALAERHTKAGQSDKARTYYRRYLVGFREGARATEAQARLALAYESAEMLGAARSTLRKLAKEPWAAKELKLDGQAAQPAGTWAQARLTQPQFAKPASTSLRDAGQGQLKEMWSLQAGNNVVPLLPRGSIPSSQGRLIFCIEEGNKLIARDGQTGQDAWKPAPTVPGGFNRAQQHCFWSDGLLIVAGKAEVAALDAQKNGAEAWRYKLFPNEETGGGDLAGFAVADQRVVLAQRGGRVTVLEANTGQEMWHLNTGPAAILDPPALGDGYVAIGRANVKPALIPVLDLETGLRRFELKLDENLVQPPVALGETIFTAASDHKVRAYDANSGKLLWEYAVEQEIVELYANYDLLVAARKDLMLVALDPNATQGDKLLRWKTTEMGGEAFAGLIVDGEDVFLATRGNNQRGQAVAFMASGGKLRWKQPTAGTPISASGNLFRGHLLIAQSTFDPQARMVSAAGLAHRGNGKLTWVTSLGSQRNFALIPFDGGVVVGDGRDLKGYVSVDAERSQAKLDELTAKARANPKDPETLSQLALLQYQLDKPAEALGTLESVLALPDLPEATFGSVFERFSHIRKESALKTKRTLPFQRLKAAPQIDGALGDWAGVAPVELKSWREVYLAGEDDRREELKPGLWNGPADQAVEFRGGFDDQHLYLAVSVTDDLHANANDQAGNLWNGDSLQLAFDMEQDKEMGYQGLDFELGFGLNAQGQLLAWRWVEKSKYVMKPLDVSAKVVRDEAAKRTVYEIALPLAYLELKPETGKAFGFTFMVNDLDKGENVEKGIAPSPGIWNPKYPGQYAQGQLTAQP